jgi:hypothetical protein
VVIDVADRTTNGVDRLITRLFVDPALAYQPAQVYRQQLRVAKMVLGGYRPRTLPIDVDAIRDMLSPKPLKVKKACGYLKGKKFHSLRYSTGASDRFAETQSRDPQF